MREGEQKEKRDGSHLQYGISRITPGITRRGEPQN
jgi:hypothetical protein